jgi:hypothetical protein
MRRALISALLLVMLAAAPAAVGAAQAAPSKLAGTWTGTMRPTGSAVSHSYRFRITIAPSGRTGTWKTDHCSGKLAFLERRGAYALYKESLTSGRCTGGGVDWVRRQGSKLYDSFKSESGAASNSVGTLRRG